MKLAAAATLSLVESTFVEPLPLLNEEGEAPRWRFRYDNWKHDHRPDILLLGAYTHPNTGNNLVGGINLNYLSQEQRDNLARVLPQIMQAGNLYGRYHSGRRLLPDVFDNFYRTYNAAYIRGVEQDVLYPKYGFLKAAKDFLKRKIGGMFKSRAQREKEAQPQFPQDLASMKDRLDQAVTQLQQQARAGQFPEPPDSPEMVAARRNFFQFQRQRSMADVERQEDEPLLRASQEIQQQQTAQQDPQAVPSQEQQPLSPQDLAQSFERERAENQAELTDPANDINLDDPELKGYFDELDQLGEAAIAYYSPVLRRYVIEPIAEAIGRSQLYTKLMNLRPQIAAAAQRIYDEWIQDEEGFDDDFGGGGICDRICEAIGDILAAAGIDSTEGGHDGDDHAFQIAYDAQFAYVVDIPHDIYESGSGYSWTKLEGVEFAPEDVLVAETERPDWIDGDAW